MRLLATELSAITRSSNMCTVLIKCGDVK